MLQIADDILQQRAAQDQFLVISGQLRADLQVAQVDHRVVGRRHHIDAGRGLILWRNEKFRHAEGDARAHEQAEGDLPGVAPQQVEQFHQVDLILCLGALDDLSCR